MDDDGEVLNALRHQRFLHHVRISTPSGTSGAQRLAASEVFASILSAFSARFSLCSTPCGIRGFCIAERRESRPGSRVLNALRHQRFLHWNQRVISQDKRGAQRLAASEVFAFAQEGFQFVKRHSCSTPCGIRGFCISQVLRDRRGDGVLNALRHQRFLHFFALRGVRARAHVLNALRHQRFLHYLGVTPVLISFSAQRLAASEVFAYQFCWSRSKSRFGILCFKVDF